MDCEHFQENISACFDKQLEKNEEKLLFAHLENCSECMAMFRSFEKLDVLIRSPEPRFDIDTETEIWNNIASRLKPERRRNSKKMIRIFFSAAAALVVSLIVFLFYKDNTPVYEQDKKVSPVDMKTQVAAEMIIPVLFKNEDRTQKEIMEGKYAEIVADQLFRTEHI